MLFDQIVENCKGPTPKAHQPAFRLEPVPQGWLVYDGDKTLVHLMPGAADIWSFSPFEPDEMANPTQTSATVDVHTVRNTWVNLGGSGWPASWKAAGSAGVKWDWRKTAGAELEAMVSFDGPDGEWARWHFTLRYDAAWGRYRYTWDIEARKASRDGLELFNMMITHALADRPDRRRWTHSVSPNADGQPMRVLHSNALFVAHGYAATRHTSYPRTWVAHLAHPSFNPTVLVHRTTVPLFIATCDQLFDQHLCWTDAGMDNLEADGYFHFRMSVEFANMRPAFAAALLASAKDPVRVRPHQAGAGRTALAFNMNGVSTFGQEVDPWTAVESPIFVVNKDPSAPIAWDQSVGRDDSRSLRIGSQAHDGRSEIFPVGAVCLVQPHKRYRLEGWVRTRGVGNFARLELASYEYTYANLIDQAFSAPVGGDKDWTRLEVTLDAGRQAYLMPKLVLHGSGMAWFDDLSLTEVPDAPVHANRQPEAALTAV